MNNHRSNGHSDEPFIPEGLEYRDEHWQKALDKIQRDEKRQDKRRMAWIFSSLAVLLLIGTLAIVQQLATDVKTPEQVQNAPGTPSPQKQDQLPALPVDADDSVSSAENASAGAPGSVSGKDLINNTKIESESKAHTPEQKVQPVFTEKSPVNSTNSSIAKGDDLKLILQPSGAELNNRETSEQSDKAQDMDEAKSTATRDEIQTTNWDHQYQIAYISKHLQTETGTLKSPFILPSNPFWEQPTWRLWAYVGLSLVTDFSSPLSDIRLDPMVGLRLEYNFNKRLFMDGGIEYFAISNVRKPYSQTSIAYDLNYQRTITTIETNQLRYLAIPLHLGYRITPKHQVFIGFGVSYMITGINEIFQYKQTPTSNTLINHYDDAGFVAGFKDFPIHTELGYAFKLGRNKSIRCAYQFGLTDITRNDYFGNKSVDRNSRLMIDLSFKLKSK